MSTKSYLPEGGDGRVFGREFLRVDSMKSAAEIDSSGRPSFDLGFLRVGSSGRARAVAAGGQPERAVKIEKMPGDSGMLAG
ncbi:hypothetical protein [Paeniglutamicibacter kerguelensis]|uniref:Uncharacterized protein n=1 Tax=Paeniglutamicibacter kerguelensis TaxID=254788 RepID=A0ABS4XBU8_9MICC|nr:hypothetical protein [Paeniglutamicibacter kerguelensis]MBP2385949.1 hypothetical protein [Paeniglutamicibacter kerguelensis]